MTILADDLLLQRALDRGWLRPAQLESCEGTGAAVADGLVAKGVLTPWQLATLRAEEWGLATVNLAELSVPEDVRRLVPQAWATSHRLVPVSRKNRTLRVAVSDPRDVDAIDELRRRLELDVETCIAPEEDIARAIERIYGAERVATDAPPSVGTDRLVADIRSPAELDAPVEKLIHGIILAALQRRASDIHLEPLERRFRVRYLVDGVLLEVEDLPKQLQLAVVSRVKIMANISIAEKRIPQDGRIQVTLDGRSLDLRVCSLPTAHGESLVMRVLNREDLRPGLADLGFSAEERSRMEQLITLPDGLLLVTGPTGSGKTTTLYGCLQQLNRPDRKIITVEDPVEYQLSGINQVPVRHEIGMTFASALRAMLRQAPNVIMVGEIRDLETAEIALNASLTGHIVFSALHTNDAPGAIARLADLGVKPFLLSASLRAILAQRLVRKTCLHCRRPYEPTAAELGALDLSAAEAAAATFMRGAGCPECQGTGYRGRTGLFELLILTDEIQQTIHEQAGAARLWDQARKLGMRTLREDGARKASTGLTTIEEVVSITVGDTS